MYVLNSFESTKLRCSRYEKKMNIARADFCYLLIKINPTTGHFLKNSIFQKSIIT